MKPTLFMLPNVCGEYQLYHRVILPQALWRTRSGLGEFWKVSDFCCKLWRACRLGRLELFTTFRILTQGRSREKGWLHAGAQDELDAFHVLCVSFLFPCRMRSTVSCYAVFFLERGTGNATLMMLIFCPTTDHKNWMREVQLRLRTEISVRFIQSIHQFIRSVCSGRGR